MQHAPSLCCPALDAASLFSDVILGGPVNQQLFFNLFTDVPLLAMSAGFSTPGQRFYYMLCLLLISLIAATLIAIHVFQ